GWVVKTELEKSDGERVNLDYYFRGGKVFNVVADGVSDLSLRRADYNSIIKTEGYDRLLSHIRQNIAKRKAGDADD
ncbi:MAG: ABC transporter substrate-binding protein, partial [Gammaproteobacteria bacterium]|nr:ABC transporter substrate-binding protein [Gammaproteobacteria bacterium]